MGGSMSAADEQMNLKICKRIDLYWDLLADGGNHSPNIRDNRGENTSPTNCLAGKPL